MENWVEDFLRDKINRTYDETVKVDKPLTAEAILNLFYVTSDQIRLSLAGPPTTAPATKDSPSDVVEESTTPGMQASSQLDPQGMVSGRAEPDFWCVHSRIPTSESREWTCPKCGAKVSYGKILVPVAPPIPSTSQKPASSLSAPGRTPAPCGLSRPHSEHKWLSYQAWEICPGKEA